MIEVNVVVVTHVELGWDCVLGVYPTKEAAIKGLSLTQEDLEDVLHVFHDQTLYLER